MWEKQADTFPACFFFSLLTDLSICWSVSFSLVLETLLFHTLLLYPVSKQQQQRMATYSVKALASAMSVDDSDIINDGPTDAGEKSSFKLIGLKDQNADKPSIARISHRRHPDPSTRVDTKTRVMGTACGTPTTTGTTTSASANEASNNNNNNDNNITVAAAGQRKGENRDPAVSRLHTLQQQHQRRNPVTGEGLTPTEPVQHIRAYNMRNKSSITFITP